MEFVQNSVLCYLFDRERRSITVMNTRKADPSEAGSLSKSFLTYFQKCPVRLKLKSYELRIKIGCDHSPQTPGHRAYSLSDLVLSPLEFPRMPP